MTPDQEARLLAFLRELAHEDRAAAERLLRHFLGLPSPPHHAPTRHTSGANVESAPSSS